MDERDNLNNQNDQSPDLNNTNPTDHPTENPPCDALNTNQSAPFDPTGSVNNFGSYYHYESRPGSGYGQQPNPIPPERNPRKPKKGGPGPGGWIAIILAFALIFGSLTYGGIRLVQGKNGLSFPSSVSETAEASKDGTSKDDTSKDGTSKDGTSDLSEPVQESDTSSENESSDNSNIRDSSSSTGTVSPIGKLSLTMASGKEQTLTIPEVVEKTADSVVEITTETVQTGQMMQQYIASGAGSGVVFTEDGYIVTNNHVISGANHITVTLHNGDSYDASLVGTDDEKDVALLKIDAKGLKPVTIGNSDELVVGQTIIVCGNPLGQLGGSVTHGIVSALDRDITISGTTMKLMQIDAAVNPGNSGGALFDEKGNLVGIVNAKSTGDGIEGIGFAIPASNVLSILDDLQEYGYVRGRASLGVTMVDIASQQTAWMYGVNETGVYIYSVSEGLSAEKAGLRPGDRIVSINGTECATSTDVKKVLADVSVGDEITMVISRNGQKETLKITVGEYIPQELREHTTSQNQ